jgi:single-strand DNA-binding protein
MNQVMLRGRLAAAAQERELPSGDRVTSFRVVVPREPGARRRSKQKVDSIECSAWTARLRRSIARLAPGDEVEVSGQLRRTFRRNGAGTASFVTVDVQTCERLTT